MTVFTAELDSGGVYESLISFEDLQDSIFQHVFFQDKPDRQIPSIKAVYSTDDDDNIIEEYSAMAIGAFEAKLEERLDSANRGSYQSATDSTYGG